MFFKKKINLDGILIAIGKNNENREVSMPYIDDLELYFVINKNNSYELLNKKDFDSVGMSLDNLKELAIKNTKQRNEKPSESVEVHACKGNKTMLNCGGKKGKRYPKMSIKVVERGRIIHG